MKVIANDALVDFVQANYPKARAWDRNGLRNWISFFMQEDFCLLVGRGNELLGMVMARPVFDPWNCLGTTGFDQEGDTLYIDLCIALSPRREVLQALGFCLLKRFGQRCKLAFHRHGSGRLIITDAYRHRERFLRPKKFKTK